MQRLTNPFIFKINKLKLGTDSASIKLIKQTEIKHREEEKKMKSTIANRLSYLGAGVGLALFAVFGLLYGSLIGGVVGLNVVNTVFGEPLGSALIPRIMVALGMLTGILSAGAIFVVGIGAFGWVIGYLIDPATWSRKETLAEHKAKH